jgi:hypothetical protein
MDTFNDDLNRGMLENGEPLEALYGVGWWSGNVHEEYLPIVQCHICGGQACDIGNEIDCENCGKISYQYSEEEEHK